MPYTASLFGGFYPLTMDMSREDMYHIVRGRLNSVWQDCMEEHNHDHVLKSFDEFHDCNADYHSFKDNISKHLNDLSRIQDWFQKHFH